jgi:hypothetical protein
MPKGTLLDAFVDELAALEGMFDDWLKLLCTSYFSSFYLAKAILRT